MLKSSEAVGEWEEVCICGAGFYCVNSSNSFPTSGSDSALGWGPRWKNRELTACGARILRCVGTTEYLERTVTRTGAASLLMRRADVCCDPTPLIIWRNLVPVHMFG